MIEGLTPDNPIPVTVSQLEQIAEEQGEDHVTLTDPDNRIFKTTPVIDDVEFTRYVQLDSEDAYLRYTNSHGQQAQRSRGL